jgi:urease accessory protein
VFIVKAQSPTDYSASLHQLNETMAVQFPPTNPPGHGKAHLSVNPSQFQTLSYAYPLKLISPDPHHTDNRVVQTLFLLSYGGGLVAGDSISLEIILDSASNLIILTQGSTKIFNTPDPHVVTNQTLNVRIHRGAALCYIPDPVQPFAKSAFAQKQRFHLSKNSSLCVCDWVTSGRPARGEIWSFWKYESRNEIWMDGQDGQDGQRLLIRDNMILDTSEHGEKLDHLGVYGTLILHGPVFASLCRFWLDEYTKMPRIGEKKWDDTVETLSTPRDEWRIKRLHHEAVNGVLWTAAQVRGCTVIKFGSRDVQGSRKWLHSMIQEDGTTETHFGERSTLCLRN